MRRVACCSIILLCSMLKKTDGLIHQDQTGQLLGAFYRVYNELGSGFMEAVYERALAKELRTGQTCVDDDDLQPFALSDSRGG